VVSEAKKLRFTIYDLRGKWPMDDYRRKQPGGPPKICMIVVRINADRIAEAEGKEREKQDEDDFGQSRHIPQCAPYRI